MENKVHCDKHGIRPGTPRYKAALNELALVAEREDFKEVGVVCPRCALLTHVRADTSQKMVDQLIEHGNDLRQRVEPGDVLVEWAREFRQCPRCGQIKRWVTRQCCDVGRAVGRWEGRVVAETLMQKESLVGPETDEGGIPLGPLKMYPKQHPGTRIQGGP